MGLPYIESYKTKMVEAVYLSTKTERQQWIKSAQYNLFKLKSKQVIIDLLTDSGTGSMSDTQWAELMLGDESYAGSTSFLKLEETVQRLTGFDYFLPTHQGRAAENVLFSALIKAGDIIPGNSHFDTTKGHIEFRKASALDCTIDEAFDPTNPHLFKGNLDLNKLEDAYKKYGRQKIPFTLITITCNTSGGQPVSLENIKAISQLSNQYQIPVYFDSARFAENAYFIKMREKAYADWSIKDIVKEIFQYGEGMTMSSKKDGLVNMGGFIATRNKEVFKTCTTFNIIYEGFITYGGMSGRDMGALAVGLEEATEFEYLQSRISQVEYLGNQLLAAKIPIQQPIGGHAIFIDAAKFLPHVAKEEFIAQTLGIELYVDAGVRGVEVGTLLADRDPISRENRFPKTEFLRLAIPRRVYSRQHMDYVAAALIEIYQRKNAIKNGYKILWEAPIMRHFTVELEKISS